MIELFSSQGCSSCPPAEEWLNDFSENPELWQKYIPLNFHVNYWDNLGWEDPFAQETFTKRQYAYKKSRQIKGVYTPGFLVNSKECRGWFDKRKSQISESQSAVLFLALKGDALEVAYNKSGEYEVHMALLGFGLETRILRGENRGKVLRHDFVVLSLINAPMNGSKAQLLKPTNKIKAKRYALVVWVTPKNSMQVLQSVGSWL